jgi:Ser/Thr protein kinase RdoA (MazF antagonist)
LIKTPIRHRRRAAIHWNFGDDAISETKYKTHGLDGLLEKPDWPPLTLVEVDELLRQYPQAGGAEQLLSFSPRPFSAASVVATPLGKVFVKRHPLAVRDREGLLEEHRLIAHLAGAAWGGSGHSCHSDHSASERGLVQPVLANTLGETVVTNGGWSYEVHPLAQGVDVYEQALSWTPFHSSNHAYAAGRALARLHLAAKGYDAPRRGTRQLVTSFTIFAQGFAGDIAGDPITRMEAYLASRPLLQKYADERDWRNSFHELLMPLFGNLKPWLGHLLPLWTHNDFHASNLMWSGDDEVSAIIDFGLADRTDAIHDIATAIERNIIEWLRMDEPEVTQWHADHLDGLLAGYEELSPLSYEERQALVAILPLVHCEFALSETDYFLSILHSQDKAYLGYERFFLAHAEWFRNGQGRGLLEHLERWAARTSRDGLLNSKNGGGR